MKLGWIGMVLWVVVALLYCGCGEEAANEPSPNGRQKVIGNVLPPREMDTASGGLPQELKLETLEEEEFLGKFRFRSRPADFFIGTDFAEGIDPTLYHFQRVEVKLPDGGKSEIRMQYFGAWAIWKNVAGNWEMLTTMHNDKGTIMHFHTLDPRFESLGSFEIARRTVDGEAVTIRRGKFTNEDTFEYTVATRNRGVLADSVRGMVVVVASGKYKVFGETNLKN